MRGKNLIILAVVAIVLVLAALFTSRDREAAMPDVIGKPVLAELPLNDVTKIVVTAPEGTATLARAEDAWVAADRYGYPADFGKIKSAVVKLSELKIGQIADIDDAQRGDLKMLVPGQAADADREQVGKLVQLFGKDDEELAALLIGDQRQKQSKGGSPFGPGGGYGGGYPDGQYVSPDNGQSVYLVTENLSYDYHEDPQDWLDKELLNVSSSDIKDVAISGPEREAVALSRPESGGDLAIGQLGEKEEMETSKASSVGSALSYLRFDDVADPSLTDEQTGMDKPVVFKATTKKGEVYSVRIGGSPEGSDKRYVRVEALFAPPPDPEAPEPEVTGEGTEPAEPDPAAEEEKARKAKERAELEEKIKQANTKCSGWTYLVPSYKADNLTATRDDLVKEKEEEKKEEAAEAVTETAETAAGTTPPAATPAPPAAVQPPQDAAAKEGSE